MADLVYSDDALNAKAAFYGAELIAYVEGDDDVPFWETIFSALTNRKIHVEECGGKEEVWKWVDRLTGGTVNAVVALDRDHRASCRTLPPPSPRVLFTFGHSIENTLFIPSTTAKVIRSISRRTCDESTCAAWYRKFMLAIRPLVILDIANEMGGCGEATIGDNCSRFMEGLDVSNAKVQVVTTRLQGRIPDAHLRSADAAIRRRGENTARSVRGHFLHSAILRYVAGMCEQLHRRVSISNDALYALFLSNFENQFNSKHPHYPFYKAEVTRMLAAV